MSIRKKLLESGLALQKSVSQLSASVATPADVSTPFPAVPAPPDPPKAQRPDVLQGIENLEEWLRKESSARLGELILDKSRDEYRRNGKRLEADRAPGNPVSLTAFADKASTYYAYRAAVRYHAAEQGALALRDYERARKTKDLDAREQARQRMFDYAADLVTYARDKEPGLPTARLVALGLNNAKTPGVPALAKAAGSAGTPKRETAKLKAANTINRKLPVWREVLWARLVQVKSPWLDHTAVASQSGARPEELQAATFQRVGDALCITINGAKVSATKGQLWRKLVIKNDGSSEFAHLFAKATDKPCALALPPDVTDYPDAFSAALARAGKQVFPAGCPRMSGYVYRHSFASDLKADGMQKGDIAAALGHAVTKTQDTYGRASGGRSGVRSLSVTCERAIKQTHDTRYTTAPVAPIATAAASFTFATPSFNDFGL